MTAPLAGDERARAAFRRCILLTEDSAASPLRRAVTEATDYLTELSGERVPSRGGGAQDLTIAVGEARARTIMSGSSAPSAVSAEGFRIRILSQAGHTAVSVVGSTPVGTARGLSRFLGMIESKDDGLLVPAAADIDTAPQWAVRGMHLNGWAANHPYSFRRWKEVEWRRYVDILFHEGVNLLFLWPSMDIIPLPLSREDEAYLEEVRRVVAYARHERSMGVWILHSANRIALSDCGVADPRLRPYWLPEVQVDLDPGQPDQLEKILRSRKPLYRIVDNADGFVIIDSDPGGWNGSPVSAYVELLRRTRAMIDRLAVDGPRVKLVSWLWQGWGYTSWDPTRREAVITETVDQMREHLAEPWMLIAGTGQYFPYLRRLGVLERTIALPYGAIEAEPSLPFTNVDPESINAALVGLDGFPELAGAMGNAQCPLLQMPQVHHLMRGLWQRSPTDGERGADLAGLSRMLYPGAAAVVSAAFAALNATAPGTVGHALASVNALVRPAMRAAPTAPAAPAGGLIGRLLFPSHHQALMDIAGQLEVRQAEAELATALEAGADAATLRPLVGVYFRRCLRWEERHGYYGVLRVGRLNSLFPRPPIPRDAIRTWPPFVPYAISLRRALLAAGDPRGDRFFEHIQRELEPEFGSEKVRRGCIDAMRAMMDRDEAK